MRKPRSDYPSEQADKFLLRLPDGMRGRIAATAKQNNRSMNAEIVATLEEKYPPPTAEEEEELLMAYRRTIKFFQGKSDAPEEVIREVVASKFLDAISGKVRRTFKELMEDISTDLPKRSADKGSAK